MTNSTSRLPLLHTIAALIVGAALIIAALVGSTAPAQAAPAAVCTTDLDCAAYELGQAIESGKPIYEDLSFDGASPLYSAKNDLLADIFWSRVPAGTDWTEAQAELLCFVKAIRA